MLYDVSSSYYTGRQSSLIMMGYSRDGKPGEPQIVYGLLCDPAGRPVAIEVFSGTRPIPPPSRPKSTNFAGGSA